MFAQTAVTGPSKGQKCVFCAKGPEFLNVIWMHIRLQKFNAREHVPIFDAFHYTRKCILDSFRLSPGL